ncbi:MAG: YdcF family protein [Gemmatimonadetes bacterium]|nr:YdcF family protein [Gemmatimonadota bacterium]
MTDRDLFLAQLFTQPLRRADLVVVLAGEDAAARLELGLQLFRQGGAPLLCLAGGRHEPPAILGARQLEADAIAAGLAPDRIVREDASQNTRQQAVETLLAADQRDAHTLLLVASSYHLPRAFLTFLARLRELERLWRDPAATVARIRIIPVAASQSRWDECPPGGDRTRAQLFHVEGVKIAEYQALGHCATYAEGLEYFKRWEGR